MRFTIVGAGAIGGITGAYLARVGHTVRDSISQWSGPSDLSQKEATDRQGPVAVTRTHFRRTRGAGGCESF